MLTVVGEAGLMMKQAVVRAKVAEISLWVFHTWCRKILPDREAFHTLHRRPKELKSEAAV